jgi:hypothetical protein
MNGFCSPVNENKKICFSDASLKKLVNYWNMLCPDKIHCKTNSTGKILFASLNTKMKKYCGNNKYWLWTGIIEKIAETKNVKNLSRIKRSLKTIAKKELKPEKPESWYKNPRTWLSNYDIQNVMHQYEQTPKYKYCFLGVFPIDFSVASSSGACLYSEFCKMDISKYIKKNKKFIGFITNLDRHDQPGSHWTSTFIAIDPKLQTYGAYYYDSTGSSIPKYLMEFLNNVKAQCDKIYPTKNFKIIQNKKQHQYKNSECGIFSMIFQIRWINKHIVKKNDTSFSEIIGNPYITDSQMLKIRDTLFRPNTKIELKKLKNL